MNTSSFKSVFGATLLITGCCIGAGMIGLPVRTAMAGFVSSTVATIFCYIFTTITGLLILEATLWFEEKVNFSTIVESILGKKGKFITLFLFLALFYSLFVAYLDGCGIIFSDIVSSLTGYAVPKYIGIILCVSLVAAITYAGTHMANRFNQLLLLGLIITYFALIVIGLQHVNILKTSQVDFMSILNVVPIMLICFGYQNLVPSITYYLNKNVNHIRFAIIIGNFIPLLVYMLWNYVILGILPADASIKNAELVTQLLGGSMSVISIIFLVKSFSLFALLTSFIPTAISLVDFIKDSAKNSPHKKISNDMFYIAIIFIPSFIFTLIYPNLFLNMLDFAGGFVDVLLFGLMPATVVLLGRKTIASAPYTVPGGKITPILILLFSIIILLIKTGVVHA
jgi:tyrosine-specific transport protein